MHQVVEQTYEEKVAMYMKSKKKKLIEMLIEANRMLDLINPTITYPILGPPPKIYGCMPKVERCPICGGNGLVSRGFYNQTSGEWSTTDITPDVCRSCSGTGVVWDK
ncbi:MAG: hypothetical protein PF440_00190 [Thiomicrorhabdus sp.]|jgi:hypothetical protein|nr:hypothetical protein [Thiomicrorhabdus sp.]